jgi:hypothetical protein
MPITTNTELKHLLIGLRELIMTTQQELAQQLTDLGTQLDKTHGEIVQKVADLEAAILAAGTVTPEVEAALEALRTKVQVLDDLNPDSSPP